MHKHFFKHSHPFVFCCYYLLMLLIAMSTTNPIIIMTCFLGSLSFRIGQLTNKKKTSIWFPLLIVGIITVTNPLFVHRGGTILFFFLNKPITLEAFIYGFFMGLMIASVIYLFQNFQESVDVEQFFYLFGRSLPKSTMILTMIFRFIPLFQEYYIELSQVQKTVNLSQNRTFKEKADSGFDLFGHFFSWTLENAMDTADSMKARGYSVTSRSSRLSFSWRPKDSLYLLGIIGTSCLFILFLINEGDSFRYYPYMESIFLLVETNWLSYVSIAVFAFLPIINHMKEVVIWTILQSKM